MKSYSAVLIVVSGVCCMYAVASQQRPKKEEPVGNVLFQYIQEKFGGKQPSSAQPQQRSEKKVTSKRRVYKKKR